MSLTRLDRDPRKEQSRRTEDPVLSMLGVGRQLWQHESGDSFVERLRSEDPSAPPLPAPPGGSTENLAETVWRRIQKYQRGLFHTAKRLPLTFEVDGNGIWFFRNQKRINRKLTRAQVEVAISRCPLRSTTEIKDLMDYPYLYAILTDPRIRGNDW